MSSGLDLAFLAQTRLRAVGWLNSLRLVHGLLEMPRASARCRSFVLAQDEPVARGAPQHSFSMSQRDFNQAGILSRIVGHIVHCLSNGRCSKGFPPSCDIPLRLKRFLSKIDRARLVITLPHSHLRCPRRRPNARYNRTFGCRQAAISGAAGSSRPPDGRRIRCARNHHASVSMASSD